MKRVHFTLCGRRPRAWTTVESERPLLIRFHYPCGYSQLVDPAKDKKLTRVASVLLLKFASGYWSKSHGGVEGECPKCRRAEQRALRQAVRT